MVLFIFYIFNLLYWIAIIFSIFVVIAVLLTDDINGLILLVFAVPFILIRGYLASKFVVKKHLSEKTHRKALGRVKKNEENKRIQLSENNSKRNIDPLIEAVRKELIERKGDVTPHTLERVESTILILRKTNDVPGVSELYRVIIETKPKHLNTMLNDYQSARGGLLHE